MIKDIHLPYDMAGYELDDYLYRGWFRMGQTIFTTDFIPVNGLIYPVYWLRFPVQEVSYGKKQKRLMAINRDFTIDIRPFQLVDEIEQLYSLYKSSIDFEAPPTVESFLMDGATRSIYDTYIIGIRDAGQLIAAGIFDRGKDSLAGIMNFYHPGYKTKSLGKYLMLLKINYALEAGMIYYYPGYIAGGFAKFDYKLFPDPYTAELFDSNQGRWLRTSGVILPGAVNFNKNDDAVNEG
jgi:arginine-tRNA-protein transferase